MKTALPLSVAVRAMAQAPQTPEVERYHGACACGAVRFEVTLDATSATRCICARCRGADLMIVYADGADFRLITGRDALTEPMQDAMTPHHFFCGRCGEAAFGMPTLVVDPIAEEPARVSINVECLKRGAPEDLVTARGRR